MRRIAIFRHGGKIGAGTATDYAIRELADILEQADSPGRIRRAGLAEHQHPPRFSGFT
jgi:hypothetical protein